MPNIDDTWFRKMAEAEAEREPRTTIRCRREWDAACCPCVGCRRSRASTPSDCNLSATGGKK